MNSEEIFEKINLITVPNNNYLVFKIESDNCYFGKNNDGNVVFMLDSTSPKISAVYQETKFLRFMFNQKCVLETENEILSKVMHVFICRDNDVEKIKAFIRLTKSFSTNDIGTDQYYLAKLFAAISALFNKEEKVSEIGLQGLFAELYIIVYLKNRNCNIACYWQSHNKMKFDFSVSEKKRIEIKSTLRPDRTHHFKHEQLLSELYDVRIVSMLLRKSDCGISLGDIVEIIRDIYADNFALMLHIETIIAKIDQDDLYSIRYDECYLKDRLRFYDASLIPHFNEKTPDGVFNAEYNCNLDMAPYLSLEEMIHWIEEDKNV